MHPRACSLAASAPGQNENGVLRRAAVATILVRFRHAGLAQLVVHLICNQGVGGSSPSAGTNPPFAGV